MAHKRRIPFEDIRSYNLPSYLNVHLFDPHIVCYPGNSSVYDTQLHSTMIIKVYILRYATLHTLCSILTLYTPYNLCGVCLHLVGSGVSPPSPQKRDSRFPRSLVRRSRSSNMTSLRVARREIFGTRDAGRGPI